MSNLGFKENSLMNWFYHKPLKILCGRLSKQLLILLLTRLEGSTLNLLRLIIYSLSEVFAIYLKFSCRKKRDSKELMKLRRRILMLSLHGATPGVSVLLLMKRAKITSILLFVIASRLLASHLLHQQYTMSTTTSRKTRCLDLGT